MAKIAEQYVIFKVSKLVKGNADVEILDQDAVSALEQVVSEAIGQIDSAAIVEMASSEE